MNRGVPHGTLVGRRVYVSGERNKQGWSPAGESRVDPRGASLAARSVPSRSRVLNDGALRAEVDVLRSIVRSLLLLSLDNKSRRLDFMYYRGRREHLVCRRAETGEAG
jgi:hypothetical protein